VTFVLADFGAGAVRLLAEYDPEGDVVRVNARAVERVRAAKGEAEAARFVCCALAHEAFHRANRSASEAEAHAFARRCCGADPRAFEALLR
jgi:hypothetical protein